MSALSAGTLQIDTAARTANVEGRALDLTPKELSILECFMHHASKMLTRSQIEQHVWNYDLAPASNLVEVYIGRIRRKLAAAAVGDPIITLRGEGYRFEPERVCDGSSDARASA